MKTDIDLNEEDRKKFKSNLSSETAYVRCHGKYPKNGNELLDHILECPLCSEEYPKVVKEFDLLKGGKA